MKAAAGKGLRKPMKGFMHIVEIVIIVIAMFMVVYQFTNIPAMDTEWSSSKLFIYGNDMLNLLDRMGVDWLSEDGIKASVDNVLTFNRTRNTTVLYDVRVDGAVKPVMLVGCMCTDDEMQDIEDGLAPFYLNGRPVAFMVEQIDMTNPACPGFSVVNDVTIIMPGFAGSVTTSPHTLSQCETQIENYLRAGNGLLLVRNITSGSEVDIQSVERRLFGIGWDESAVPAARPELLSPNISNANSTLYLIGKYFRNFPVPPYGMKFAGEPQFDLLSPGEKVVPEDSALAMRPERNVIAQQGGSALSASIAMSGLVDGRGRTMWISKPESGGFDDNGKNQLLLKAAVAWLAGETYTPVSSQMESPVISKLYTLIRPIGIAAAWEMGEGSGSIAYDSSGNGCHGAINGAAWRDARGGKGLEFNGIDSSVAVSGVPNITKEITIAAWIKRNWTGGRRYQIASRRDENRGYELLIDANNKLNLSIYDPGGRLRTTDVSIGRVDSENIWYHVAATFNGTEIRYYINGNPSGVRNMGNTQIGRTASGLSIGDSPAFPGFCNTPQRCVFNGTMSNVMVFGRALGAQEIKSQAQYPGQLMYQPVQVELTLGYIY